MKRIFAILGLSAVLFAGCGTVQSVVKSTFPYTTLISIPASSTAGSEYTAVNKANSFDQVFSRDGNNAYKINQVHVSSAKLRVDAHSDYNIGNLESIKVYIGKDDGSNDVLIASRTDIGPDAGRSITLDTDEKVSMDQLVRQKNIRVRFVYKVRKAGATDAIIRLTLGIDAHAAD